MSWFTTSNRWRHFVLAFPASIFTSLFVIGLASGMEFKDCHYDGANLGKPVWKWTFRHWDWLDWGCTVAGGVLGDLIKIGIILLII